MERPIPVAAAQAIGEEYAKVVVVVVAWSESEQRTHVVTWGREAAHKHAAAALGPILAAAAGADTSDTRTFEDFRLLTPDTQPGVANERGGQRERCDDCMDKGMPAGCPTCGRDVHSVEAETPLPVRIPNTTLAVADHQLVPVTRLVAIAEEAARRKGVTLDDVRRAVHLGADALQQTGAGPVFGVLAALLDLVDAVRKEVDHGEG